MEEGEQDESRGDLPEMEYWNWAVSGIPIVTPALIVVALPIVVEATIESINM